MITRTLKLIAAVSPILLAALASTVEAQVNDDGQNSTVMASPLVKFWNSFNYTTEVVMISVLLLWTIVWKAGKGQNQKVAKKWLGLHLKFFNENFAQVGDDNHALIRDGPQDFYFYLTGRINCRFVLGKIALKPRHDLFTVIYSFVAELMGWKKPEYDCVTFEANLPDGLMDPFVFAVTRGGDAAKATREERFDVQKFTKQGTSQLLPSGFVVHTAANDVSNLLLDGDVGHILRHNAKWFENLIITTYPKKQPLRLDEDFEHKIIFSFNLPPSTDSFQNIVPLGELAINLIDIVADKCRFRNEVIKSKLTKQLAEIQREFTKADLEKRETELQEKKIKKKKEEEERVRKLSPEEQRKWEEKEYQKQLKKDMKKRTKRA